MQTIPYSEQRTRWPQSGQHILAAWDDDNVVVYQAFNDAIADFAVENQLFGGPAFSVSRMTWIKTNFLWMMYRCGWATKDKNQTRVLAITLRRAAFEELLARAWPSSFQSKAAQARFATREEWQAAKAASGCVLQWDPDHGPRGEAQQRRAVQVGIRPKTVQELYNTKDCIVSIRDVTAFVAEQRARLEAGEDVETPIEIVYEPINTELRTLLALDDVELTEVDAGATHHRDESKSRRTQDLD